MPRHIHVFDSPDRFVTGTVGLPGQRTFFLQAREGERLVSVALEKLQVAVLGQRLTQLLDEVDRRTGVAPVEPALPDLPAPDEGPEDTEPLDEPISEAFRVGALTISWDGDEGSIVVEARAMGEEEGEPVVDLTDDDDDESGPDILRVKLSRPAARAFVRRADRIVAAGRPPCPFCGEPLNPEGHICARRNGYVH